MVLGTQRWTRQGRSALSRQEGPSATGLVSREGIPILKLIGRNCDKEVATDGVREATQSRSSESPSSSEGRKPEQLDRRRRLAEPLMSNDCLGESNR